jgi:predicted acyl esterase
VGNRSLSHSKNRNNRWRWCTWQRTAKHGKALFNFKFAEETELSGYMKLRIWVEARPVKTAEPSPHDMAMFISINKLDRDGNAVHFNGSIGNSRDMVTRGEGKVSRRELASVESTEWHPVLKGTSEQKLTSGEIVPVDIELYPSSTFFSVGETLQLIIAPYEIVPSAPYKKSVDCNNGQHVLHFGAEYDSHLLVPKILSSQD